KRFAYSIHYSTLTPQVFFRAEHPLQIDTKADLKRYRGCGLTGASYAHYGLEADEVERGVTGYANLVMKLKLGRCEYFVAELQVAAGFPQIAQPVLGAPALVHRPVPDAQAPSKYLLAAKDSRAARLLPEVNAELDKLLKSGEAAKLWLKHGGSA